MTKIRIFYDKEEKLLRVPAILKVPHARIVSDFILDTGSPHTILNYTDSIRLGIPHTEKSEIVRMGGRAYQRYTFNKFEMVLKSQDNQAVTENLPIRILIPCSLKSIELINLDKFPNLLGMDFLEKGYKLFCDINNKDIKFEKE